MRRFPAVIAVIYCGGIATAQTLRDDFDSAALDQANWSTKQIQPDQMRFLKPGRCGAAAIEVLTRDGDNGLECDDDCQRAELRTAKRSWPAYGDEVWYAFSFRIDANVPSTGSARSVIGQWKAPNDFSPFVAQRFDNGVFHITVQDNETRRVIAKADGDPDKMLLAQQLLGEMDSHDPHAVAAVQSLQSLDLLAKSQPKVSQQFFSKELLETLGPTSHETPHAKKLSDALGLKDSALVSQFGDMSFVADPEKYLGHADIEIMPEAKRLLPDPRKGWVDMVYRIKGGRTDNEYGPKQKGEVDIWANGQKIVSVRGNLGATLTGEKPEYLMGPYFKFGLYRLRISGPFTFQFDEFSQAPTRSGLATVCAAQ